MKSAAKIALFGAVIAALVWLMLHAPSPKSAFLADHLGKLRWAQAYYHEHPTTSIFLFALVHFLCATFAVPGSCTTLNIGSGAVFGFWVGSAVVYPLTVFSGCFGYFCATYLRNSRRLKLPEATLARLEHGFASGGLLFLVTLRLSPFLPYGVLNPALGFLRVPFGAFFASTVVGIFFDVALLNSIGAAIAAAGEGPAISPKYIVAGFVTLLAGVSAVRYAARRLQPGGLP
jgi:uncharacterized membrane protein YdjX (TVP38/TMEM64 family)